MRNLNVDPRPNAIDATLIQQRPSFTTNSLATNSGPSSAQAPKPAPQKIAVLGPTLHFKGELSAEEDFIFQGRIEGSITHTQSVTIGMEGSVAGNIQARLITIDGTVEGDLHASESVIVHETGRVTGNIYAPRVGIVEGAFFSGRVEMVGRQAGDAAQTFAKRRLEVSPGVPLSSDETERVLTMGRT